MSNVLRIEIPEIARQVLGPPRGSVRYRGLHGGRGSAKSRSAATIAAVWGAVEPLRILCGREYQSSIKESFHAELKGVIESNEWLRDQYDIGVDYLRAKATGSEFLFRGLRHSINTVRSLANIDLTILEEAEDIQEASWLALEATVFRSPKSELWALWNPKKPGSPVDNRLRLSPPERSLVREINWRDNPFFPAGLEELRQYQRKNLDPATYNHIWEGAYLKNSKAQVFAGKYTIDDFTPKADWDGPYQGGDFGFSQDPLAAVRCWISGTVLYIEREAGGVGIEIDHHVDYINERIPGFDKHATRWDNARPESISYLKRHGHPRAEAVSKWRGSVEDGITFMKSFSQIVIHSRCKQTANEFDLYSYKVDRLSGEVRSEVVDAFNHYIDAIRYALDPLIARGDGYSIYELRKAVA